jgi:hypothetical protein
VEGDIDIVVEGGVTSAANALVAVRTSAIMNAICLFFMIILGTILMIPNKSA